jgi:hypothetical protein
MVLSSPAPAADCSVKPRISPSMQYQCVMDHASFVYDNVCGAVETCHSTDAQLVAAYDVAANLYDRRHPIDEDSLLTRGADAELERFAQVSQTSAIMHVRARHWGKASNAFVTCVELAERAYAHTHSVDDHAQSASCAASNVTILCAQEPDRAGCGRAGAVNVSFAVETTISRAHFDSATADDTTAGPSTKTTVVESQILMPDGDDIDALANSLSDDERRDFQSATNTKDMRIEKIDSSR